MMKTRWNLGLQILVLSILSVATTYSSLVAKNLTKSCHEQERLALLKFKHSIKDDTKLLSSWTGIDCCTWKGVRCDSETGRVDGLLLRGNYNGPFGNELEEDCYLVGDKVDANLAELSHLKYLDLSGNNFEGSKIPEFIGSFKQLRYLNLSNGGFNGIIPHHIGNLSSLKVLDLSSSSLVQTLMSNDLTWVSALSSLEYLDLSEVDLFQAKNFDMVFFMIPSLVSLRLRECILFYVDLGLHLNSSHILPNIEHLDLSSNFFEGQLPPFFRNMTSLTFLDLSSYNLSQALNTLNLLSMIPSLSELHLSRCGLYNAHLSPIHFNSTSHSSIHLLDLAVNSLEGRLPLELMNMSFLRVLDVSQNNLNSTIPIMPNLLKLDVSYNNIKHIEHTGIWRQCHLKELSLSGNYFGEEMIGQSTNMSECSQYSLQKFDLTGSHLNGSIPEYLGKLTNLRILLLKSNSLTGSIPKSLERLKSLEVLDLSFNDLTGSIPTFHGKLTKLYLNDNQFSSAIPESLGRLSCLIILHLHSNQLTGPIPTSVGRLASLQSLSVSSNLINGTIPVSIGQLTNLVVLDVSNNSLEGSVSEAHFANLHMLRYLDTTSNHQLIFNISHQWMPPFQLRSVHLGSCKIEDGFPQWLQTQVMLNELVLSNSSLNGLLPTWLRKMPIIPYLDLSHNNLSGPLGNLPIGNPIIKFEVEFIESLLLQDNFFNGSIPMSLCRRTRLTLFDASRNRLSGNIPECIGNLQQISMLILSSNELSGVLPSSLGNISSSLAWLKLNDNKFNGKIPRELGRLRFLRVLDLGTNEFFGKIPYWIGENLTYLMVLRFHANNFAGSIPQSLCKCSYIQILDVAHNNLVGSIPHCFGELNGMIEARQLDIRNGSSSSDESVIQVLKGIQLEYAKTLDLVFNLDLSSNKLTGEVPLEITTLTLLVGLNLSNNQLTGSIPNNIGNMKALNSLDFSHNQFTGMIPPSMASLNFLSYLNMSHNNLSGRIPTGNQLQTLTVPSIYAGNRDLCGAPLPNECFSQEKSPTTKTKDKYEYVDEPKKVWFYLDIVSGFITGFWGIIGVLFFKKQWGYMLFKFADVTMDQIYVVVAVRVSKIKRGRNAT